MQCAHLAFQRKIWSVGWKIIACSVELKCSNLIEKVENVRNVDDQIWNFSYYSDNDIINIRRFCRHLNIPKEKCAAFQNV